MRNINYYPGHEYNPIADFFNTRDGSFLYEKLKNSHVYYTSECFNECKGGSIIDHKNENKIYNLTKCLKQHNCIPICSGNEVNLFMYNNDLYKYDYLEKTLLIYTDNFCDAIIKLSSIKKTFNNSKIIGDNNFIRIILY